MDKLKSLSIDGNVVGELFATFQDGDALIDQIRRRAAYVGLSYGVIEDISGMSEGSLGKYISPLQVKALTITSLMKIASALGMRAVLYVDPKLVRQMKQYWEKRDETRVHAKRLPCLGPAQMRRILKPVAAEMGRRGGKARMAALTPEQSRELGRRGAAARWHKQP